MAETTISPQAIYYAGELDFNLRMVTEDEVITEAAVIVMHTQALYPEFFDPFYTDFVLVETEEEALTFSDSVITAWPSENTFEILNAINWIILGNAGGLSVAIMDELANDSMNEFPIGAPVDAFEDWEGIYELINSLNRNERVSVQVSTGTIRREANSPEFLAELESLKEQRNTEVSE